MKCFIPRLYPMWSVFCLIIFYLGLVRSTNFRRFPRETYLLTINSLKFVDES